MHQKNEELEQEIFVMKRDAERLRLISEAAEAERKRADGSYAPIIVKTIVFTFIGLICVAFVTIFTNAVIKWINSVL